MDDPMPTSLLISWVLFFGFLNTHQRHAMHFQGSSYAYFFALQFSLIMGCLVGIGLLIYYFFMVSWYWPLILFFVGSLIGGFLFAYLDVKLGPLVMSLISFIGWPVFAIWTYFIISGLNV